MNVLLGFLSLSSVPSSEEGKENQAQWPASCSLWIPWILSLRKLVLAAFPWSTIHCAKPRESAVKIVSFVRKQAREKESKMVGTRKKERQGKCESGSVGDR